MTIFLSSEQPVTHYRTPGRNGTVVPTINLYAVSSTDECQVPVKPKNKSKSTAAHHSAVSFLIVGTEANVDIVLVPNSEDSATESSEDDSLAGDHTSVREQLQSEVRVTSNPYTADIMDCQR
jgi:hypothetical protein